MDILHLIDRLEELFNDSRAVPLTRNVMVDEDKMLDIIDQMRISIPEEVKKAQQLLAQRDRVMAQAQEEANRTVEIARGKAEELVHRDLVVQEAQRRADQIVSQARGDAENIRHEADEYVIVTLQRLQDELGKLAHQVQNGIQLVEEEQTRRAQIPAMRETAPK